jgi:putative salt-induced outer membrane protein YdiY
MESAFLLLAPHVAVAQTGDFESRVNELSGSLSDSVQPAAFVSTRTCKECANKVSCSSCGSCSHCCTCGKLLHRWTRLWDGGFDVGLNGAAGNSQDLNIIVGFDAKRKSGLNTVSTELDYFLTQEDSDVTKNRLYALGQYERDIPNSAWNWFSDAWYEFDQFKDYDSRIGLHVGAGALLRETDRFTLKGRIGVGTSKEFGSADDEWSPEGLAGLKYERKLTDRQKLTARVDYYPDVGNLSSFRFNAKANWVLLIDEEMNLSLKIGAYDRYDSTPSSGDQPNDIDYWISLHWGF